VEAPLGAATQRAIAFERGQVTDGRLQFAAESRPQLAGELDPSLMLEIGGDRQSPALLLEGQLEPAERREALSHPPRAHLERPASPRPRDATLEPHAGAAGGPLVVPIVEAREGVAVVFRQRSLDLERGRAEARPGTGCPQLVRLGERQSVADAKGALPGS